jgi:uncharacterized membrane protein YtjA (UPF0391 family)
VSPRNTRISSGPVEAGSTLQEPLASLVVTPLIIALIAAALGFGGIDSTAVGPVKIVFSSRCCYF